MENTKTLFKPICPTEELRSVAEKYPWWGAMQCALSLRGEKCASSALLAKRTREQLTPLASALKSISPEEFERSEMLGIIDQFLREGEHRIVIDETTTDLPIDNIDEEDDLEEEFVSEELAEIYAKQHLFDLAIEIYQKLSLQNSQKSAYFAELIERLKKEQQKGEQ
ncbi:MAG: hypothetical protein J6U53_03920 [Tidjanibacter sp.]|nr:hypothetical protein [Tidjanibacter sp.]